jgi:hypothetical protein
MDLCIWIWIWIVWIWIVWICVHILICVYGFVYKDLCIWICIVGMDMDLYCMGLYLDCMYGFVYMYLDLDCKDLWHVRKTRKTEARDATRDPDYLRLVISSALSVYRMQIM